MMQDMEWSVGHSVMAHWPSEISGIFTDLTSFDGSIFFQCQLCIENYVCFWEEEGGRFAIDIRLVDTEEEGIGMVQNIHIYKHLKHL